MQTRTLLTTILRASVVAACALPAGGCGSEMLRTGRAPVFLSILSLSNADGETPVLSDVLTDGAVINDVGAAEISVESKNQTGFANPQTPLVTTPLNSVTITRYRVEYRRTDGRNEPGRDVPFAIDGATTATITAGTSGTVQFDLVRHAAKLEPPLRNLSNVGGQLLISTVAVVTFYGHDQNGNEVTVTGMVDVTFGDFPDA